VNTKPFALVAAILLLIPSARGQDSATREVEKALKALNEAFAKGDAKAVVALTTEDHRSVTPYYGGAQTRDEQIKSLPDLKLEQYKPGPMKVRMVGADTALVTYELAMKGTYKGKPVAARSYASALWVKKGGLWLEAYYQETPLSEKP
jgi:ketosteroid isomerase-like protein